jgi:hypothetical protein
MLAERSATGTFASLGFLDLTFASNVRKATFCITNNTSSQLNNRFVSDHK